MRRMKEFSERQVETLNKKLMEADERFQCLKTDLCKQMDLIKGGVDMDMLQEVNVRDKEIAELIKRCELAEAAVQQNEDLKGKVQRLEKDRAEAMDKLQSFEVNMKQTSRRLSKSYESEIDLNDTVSKEMFVENSSGSPPFHGFSTVEINTAQVNTENTSVKLKRSHSSPGTAVASNKKKIRHPTVGSKVVVETVSGRGVYLVQSKSNDSETDFTYNLERDGKLHILNFERLSWAIYDGGEKIPMKNTV